MKVLNRIKKNADFNRVIEEGRIVKSDSLTLYFQKNTLGFTRIGISIPKKSGNAVVRNKMRRQIRAIIASDVSLDKSYDVILIARKQFDINQFIKTKQDINELFKKVG